MMATSSRSTNDLNASSIALKDVSLSTAKKFGRRFLSSSPIPPSRNPVHVSSSPMTAISLPRAAEIAMVRK
ncbi:hypothetical protein T265_07217 [Opisthorchis viverrini]|uniref:Uncharacterized protein n=1 Tax=Opisthorchis viverrini TaxID=6198 RepID=A0A074ZPU4_OPIVI|nr:hypothetical protein T265_07217 [Opisthorchis viverrini]KER25345.1 hypothetical protein T265_07217 [Opisthorchis viverrini]